MSTSTLLPSLPPEWELGSARGVTLASRELEK
jgi:hypothetical protein